MSDDDYETYPYFEGPCTCDHEQEDHDWGACDIMACKCVAGWTE